MPDHVQYLLIGGGLTSSAAIEAIRQIDSTGSILMVSQENIRPYNRPALSKEYLRGQIKRHELFTRSAEWFTQHHATLRTAQRCASIDIPRHAVTLASGEQIVFDKLLLATGSTPNRLSLPGADLPNVHYIRTLDDLDRLHHALAQATREGLPHPSGRGRVTIIGAGLLGVELAGSLSAIGIGVDLVSRSAGAWDTFAGPTMAGVVSMILQKNGVTVHTAAQPTHFEGDGRVQRIRLDNGSTVHTDIVIVAIGTTPNKSLLRGTTLNAERAILVDTRCRTSHPDIYAAGDCCAIFDPLFDKYRIIDHADHASMTGIIAGRNMAGVETHYDAVNFFYSEFSGNELSAWGERRFVDHHLLRGRATIDTPDFVELGIATDGRIVQALALNHHGEDHVLRELIANKINIAGREEQLKDPAFSLASLL